MNSLVRSMRSERAVRAAALVVSVVVISGLHYLASMHAVLVHEILKRLYYVPIVVAAIHYGIQGGLATSLLSSALYLPHIVMSWSAWPVFEVGQYGEIILFNVVGAVTGVMADRLRSERNRYRHTSQELEVAYRQLEASTNEQVKAERMATVGRVAAGVAHEIRTPLSAILGCFEILAGDFPDGHPKLQFIEILKKEIARAESVVTTFLDFAQPAPPRRRSADVNDIVRAAARRFALGPTAPHAPAINLDLSPSAIMVTADSDQVERAIVELLITGATLAPQEPMTLSTVRTVSGTAEIHVLVNGMAHRIPEDVFETFDERHCTNALMLPLIRRLLENQEGTVSASTHDTDLDVIIALPRSRTAATSAALSRTAAVSVAEALEHR